MPAPQPRESLPGVGHPNYLIFTGSGTIKASIKDFGYVFDAEAFDDTVHAIIIDPRFSTSDVMDYIVELGGSVYEPPPEPPGP